MIKLRFLNIQDNKLHCHHGVSVGVLTIQTNKQTKKEKKQTNLPNERNHEQQWQGYPRKTRRRGTCSRPPSSPSPRSQTPPEPDCCSPPCLSPPTPIPPNQRQSVSTHRIPTHTFIHSLT